MISLFSFGYPCPFSSFFRSVLSSIPLHTKSQVQVSSSIGSAWLRPCYQIRSSPNSGLSPSPMKDQYSSGVKNCYVPWSLSMRHSTNSELREWHYYKCPHLQCLKAISSNAVTSQPLHNSSACGNEDICRRMTVIATHCIIIAHIAAPFLTQ